MPEDQKDNYIPHLVVGSDLFSLATFNTLTERFGRENVAIVSATKITKDLAKLIGPSGLRGDVNTKVFRDMFPELEYKTYGEDSFFYKESKLHSFSSRTKPEKMLWGEDFFKSPRIEVSLETLFPFLKDTNFFASLNHKKHTISAITPLKDNSFKLETYKDEVLFCDKLYFGDGPHALGKLISPREAVSTSFLEFCSELATPLSLNIKLIFESSITQTFETLFIPLSFTYDWGHFIGEFTNECEANFVCYMDENISQEDEVSKKFRILIRNLEKVFPTIKKIKYKKYFSLNKKTPCQEIDDEKFKQVSSELPNLHFIGLNAPVTNADDIQEKFGYPSASCTHLIRGFLNHQNLLKNLINA